MKRGGTASMKCRLAQFPVHQSSHESGPYGDSTQSNARINGYSAQHACSTRPTE
ncbi:hypothetical protein BCR44DRAFT_1441235 [Catenaria anguillulae PL171]|uniref:Uncharacterized protein n=1 Tax=Catenaria anguillulae PL171 TaxID=765915 RepID=A0A1Y2HG44_9FUNG|nr:hypothetical protein BCR44DRAFT_1441235 [Catenaria anguillulae PL171]